MKFCGAEHSEEKIFYTVLAIQNVTRKTGNDGYSNGYFEILDNSLTWQKESNPNSPLKVA